MVNNKQWNILLDGRNLSSIEIFYAVLKNRGITDIEEFLHPSDRFLIPYEQLCNIKKAKDIILNTISNNGKFLIYGDVDTDGCTATAIMYRYLKHYTDKIDLFINKGKTHGVDDSLYLPTFLSGIDTLIVLDSLNNDNPQIYDQILSYGINLIILDHHVPTEYILKNNEKYCLVSSAINYSNPALSGAGVTWKVASYIDKCTNKNYADEMIDLAATGIVGDVCDVGKSSMENRYICYRAFKQMFNPGIKEIIGKYAFNSTAIAFSIAPLVNSANRFDKNYDAIELFISDDVDKLRNIIEDFKQCKEYQKERTDELYNKVLINQIENQKDKKCIYCMINSDKNLSGLLATKVSSEFCRPAMVLSLSEDKQFYSGSMRAVGIDDFRKIINDSGNATCSGHEKSAGVTIPANKFFDVYDFIENALQSVEFVQKIDVDVRLSVPQISSYLVNNFKEVNNISGNGFPPILVAVEDVDDYDVTQLSRGKHLCIKSDDVSFIKWNFTDWDDIKPSGKFSAVGTLEESYFGKKVTQQLIINDFNFT